VADWSNLAGGRDADQQPRADAKKLFGDQHRKRRADGASLADAGKVEGEKFGVIAGPSFMHEAPRRSV
jgi:hypothetical protein